MRGVIAFVFTLIVVVVIAWLGLWWYAEGRLQAGFEAWAKTAAAQGGNVTYSGIQRGTSPQEAVVTVNDLAITLPATGVAAQPVISLPTLGLRIEAASPTTLHLDLPNKISFSAGPNLGFAMNSGSIAETISLNANALFNKSALAYHGGDFAASDVDFLASSGSLLVLHVDGINGHVDFNTEATSGQTALDETLTINGAALSPMMTKFASVPFNGQITTFGFKLNVSGPVPPQVLSLPAQLRADQTDPVAEEKLVMPLVHQWASQGGNGSIGLILAIGPSTASADASLKFDANLQPEGTANLTADHLDAFASAITNAYPQVADSIAQAEAQLTPYITTNSTTGQTLIMHATYGAGSVSINGTKVAPLPPVDWNTLENPPPASDAATSPSGQ
jgi:hypothetical protein